MVRVLARAVAVVALLLTAIAPSAGTAQQATNDAAPEREQLSISSAKATEAWTGDLDGMIDRRVIRVLTAYSRTFYSVDKGVQRGGTYDIFQQFDRDLNSRLAKESKLKNKNLKVNLVFIPVKRDQLLPALAAGKGDIAAANLTVTDDRLKLVDFSTPLYPDVSEVVVSGPGEPVMAKPEDLSGKTVCVRRSSSYYESLIELNKRLDGMRLPPVTVKLAPENLESEDLIEMVNAGLIPLTVIDKHIASFWKQVFPNIVLHDQAAIRTNANIAWAIRKDSPLLKAAVDDFVSRHGKGTAVGNAIFAKYLKNTKYVKDATSEQERKKFLQLVDYFKKYGSQYNVDWLLMAAQGYQESQLNQQARSRVGAIGVMQVMPATAKDLKVGDITQIEPNIHAGVKYMRWMIDQYYGREPMTQLDKALFAFASYNAGAGRISQLRREAAKRGLDPNVWFRNVEYVVADKIGAETVTYVSNIYKYYIAYSLVSEANAEGERAQEPLSKAK